MTLAMALVACIVAKGQDVRHNSMPGVDFSKFHTYKWVDIEGGTHPNQIVDAEIKQSIESQLASKGMTKTDSDKADLLVGYQIAVDKEKQWNAYGTGRGFGGGMGTATQSTINVGSLLSTQIGTERQELFRLCQGDCYEKHNTPRQLDHSLGPLRISSHRMLQRTGSCSKSRTSAESGRAERSVSKEQASSGAIQLGRASHYQSER